MKAVINPDLCIGCQLCVQTVPSVFAMENDKAIVIIETVPQTDEDSCKDTADSCPAGAITIE